MEQWMSALHSYEDVDAAALREGRTKRLKVLGSLETELKIEHYRVPVADMDLFVDGWVTGKRNEPPQRHGKKPDNASWRYGYALAQERRLYFTQALHSFLILALGEADAHAGDDQKS
jgi:hypothetical protein